MKNSITFLSTPPTPFPGCVIVLSCFKVTMVFMLLWIDQKHHIEELFMTSMLVQSISVEPVTAWAVFEII